MKTITNFLMLIVTSTAFAANSQSAHVSFANLKNNAVISNGYVVKFEVSGMTVEPAGTMTPNTGHFHLIIDGALVPKGTVIPKDATHIHFGKGQMETTLDLKPGRHKLILQFADGAHVSYGPALSKTIHVTIQ